MRKYSRRQFLQYSGLASTAMLVPAFLKGFQNSSGIGAGLDKILVVIQLSGGNDGLNTVVPFNNDIYYKKRPTLGIPQQQVLKLNDEMGFNPAMAKLRDIFNNGEMTILNNVGYPNPDRSHFRSMNIWQTASGSSETLTTGWIGRYLDSQCKDDCFAHMAIEVDDMLSQTLKGAHRNGIAVSRPDLLYKATQNPFLKRIASAENMASDANLDYLYKTMVETTASADYIYEYSKIYTSKNEYPTTEFGRHMKRVAEMIISGINTCIYYVSLGSFDTHSNQPNTQPRLLQQLAEGLHSFADDLKQNDRFKDVLVFTFSEFGRRVSENASRGTDHGTANNIFLFGKNLKHPGIFNETPDLNDLDEGDLKHRLDFRQLYATVLNKWLGANDELILGKKFEILDII
ncbi:MAG: DUF1501 domain-containing protein [Chitinophagales bacterium]|nr:DUF1501 domain-containing protein [Chitinophagales bacterium]